MTCLDLLLGLSFVASTDLILVHIYLRTHTQTPVANLQQMAAPRLEGRGDGFVAVAWEPVEGAEKYAVEMRPGMSPRWAGVGLVNGTSVKKKNLKGKESYHFRVKPLGIGKRVLQPLSPSIHQSMPRTGSASDQITRNTRHAQTS